MALRRKGTVERIAITSIGLVPFVGVVFLDWSIANAIAIAIWDTVLGTLRVVPAAVVEDVEDGNGKYALARIAGTLIGGILTWLLIVLVFVSNVGQELHDLVATFHPGGLIAEADRLVREEPWWLALFALVRIGQSALDLARDKRRGKGKAMSVTMDQLALLFIRGVAIVGLAWLASRFAALGPGVLVAYLGAASALQVWFEIHGQELMHRPTWREGAGGDRGGR